MFFALVNITYATYLFLHDQQLVRNGNGMEMLKFERIYHSVQANENEADSRESATFSHKTTFQTA